MENSVKAIRKRQGIVGTTLIALDAARRVMPQIIKIAMPQLEGRFSNAAVDAVLSVVDAPDAGPLVTMGSWYAYAAASDPDELPYDLSFWRAAVSVAGTGLGTWLIARRSSYAWSVLGAVGAVSAAMTAAQTRDHKEYVTKTWDPGSVREFVFNRAMPVLHGVIGIIGIGAPWMTSEPITSRIARHIPEAITTRWPTIRRLGLYYMVFSIVGHWAEMLFCLGIKHGIFQGDYDNGENKMLWDQWLFPFPAEGSAAVLMALILHPAKQFFHGHALRLIEADRVHKFIALPVAFLATWLLNQVICTGIDYTTGMVANRDYSLWDYREMPFNFQGQICLQNSLVYTAIATWAAWILFPRMERGMELLGDTALNGSFVTLGSFFLFLELLYHVLPPKAKGIAGEAEGATEAETEAEAEAGTETETEAVAEIEAGAEATASIADENKTTDKHEEA